MSTNSVSPVLSVFKKDLQSEIRTRYALNALFMFVVTTLSVVLFSLGNENVSPQILSGVFWIIIFFSTMSGLSRTFITEEERNTVMTLRLTAKPLSVFYGKLLFNTVLLTGLNIVTVSLFLIVIPNFTILNYGIFVTTMLFATIGLSASSTILAAIISKANVKGTLYPVLSFPIMLPLLLSVINATRLSVENAPFMEAIGEFQVLLSYSVVILTVSYLLFEFIWND